jgi:hypothetical protein
MEPFQNHSENEQHTGQARYEETTENSHIGHSNHPSKIALVEVRNI